MNKYSIEKVANAIVYFVDNGVEYFGKTKLMKLMFFADKYRASCKSNPQIFQKLA